MSFWDVESVVWFRYLKVVGGYIFGYRVNYYSEKLRIFVSALCGKLTLVLIINKLEK